MAVSISRLTRLTAFVLLSSSIVTQSATLKKLVKEESKPPDPNEIVLGFPIPDPIGHPDPAGFRSHDDIINAMNALQAGGLVGMEVLCLSPVYNRAIPVYRITSGGDRRKNDPASYKPQVLFTAGVHAREWIGVEVAARFAEALVRGYPSDPKIKYLLENAEVYILPDLNVDGRLHTEKHPDQYWELTPYERIGELERHGRMRRKNLEGVDKSRIWSDELTVTGDLLNNFLKGVDLNRNMKSPGWVEGLRDPYSLDYSGDHAGSSREAWDVEKIVLDLQHLTAAVDIHSAKGVLNYLPVAGLPDVDSIKAFSRDKNTGRLVGTIFIAMKKSYIPEEVIDRKLYGAVDDFIGATKYVPTYTMELKRSWEGGAKAAATFVRPHDEVGKIAPQAIAGLRATVLGRHRGRT